MSGQRFANLVSTGSYLPETEITNDMLRERFKGSAPQFVDKMEKASGIARRWYAPPDWAASDLALRASQQALDRAGKRAEDLDLVILGTDSPDYITPATSVVLQSKLGAKNAGTFDVGCACASFTTAIASASSLMAANRHLRTVLVTGVYMMHKLADENDPMIFFYGDGAGAAILELTDEPGFLGSSFRADGTLHRNWLIQAGGTVEPASVAAAREGRTVVRMIERYPPEINDQGWPRLVRDVARNCEFEVSDIDFVIFTQVRRPTIELVMKDLGLPMERTHMVMDRMGYTGSACIPMALDDALRQEKIRPNDLVVMVGSGVGYNQAAVAIRMPQAGSTLFV